MRHNGVTASQAPLQTDNIRPKNKTFGVHNWNTPQSTPNEHVKQEWCETSGKVLSKWLTKFWYISRPNMTQKAGLWGRSSTPLW